jgi:hypothetical protein
MVKVVASWRGRKSLKVSGDRPRRCRCRWPRSDDAAPQQGRAQQRGLLGRVVGVFGLFLGVEVIQVAEELVEACAVGRNLFRSPRWFLPNWPVAYGAA